MWFLKENISQFYIHKTSHLLDDDNNCIILFATTSLAPLLDALVREDDGIDSLISKLNPFLSLEMRKEKCLTAADCKPVY